MSFCLQHSLLKYILSDISIVSLQLFFISSLYCLHSIYIFFCLFTLKLFVSLSLKYVSCRQHIVRFLKIQLDNPLLLMGVFNHSYLMLLLIWSDLGLSFTICFSKYLPSFLTLLLLLKVTFLLL